MTPIAFTAIGLGMGFPYILLGLFPSLSRLLPQPGAWMETFKQLMGFVLLFVAAWMFISINNSNTRPTFALLMAVWLGCWIAGQVAIYEPLWKRARAWVFAASVTTAIGLFAFSFLQSTADSYGKGVVKWERYDEARLQALHAEGRTVMLDFTADWCANCKTNSLVALNTQEVSDMLKELDAVPMLADLSDDSPLIWEKLYELKGGAIPYLAIYPGKDPKAPIVMPSIVTKSSVLEALRQAGPSKTVEGNSGKTGTAKNSAKENKKEVSLSEQAPRR